MAKILVTGGLGFIGSHTVLDLIDKGYEPLIVDNLSNSNVKVLDNLKRISGRELEFIKKDVALKEEVVSIFNSHDIDAVIHFAANKAVGESVANPLKYYRNNLDSLLNLLDVGGTSLKAFIFSSSCTVYGNADTLPVTEQSPIKPAESPYGNTKQIGEEILNDFCKVNPSFNAVSLRYFNPIGAHHTALIGELPLGKPENLIPYLTQTAIGIREKLSVFGGDYNTPDGTCIRDYIHVADLASAHVMALDYVQKASDNYDVFNIGTGKGSSVLEVIKTFEKETGVSVNYEIVERRPGDVEQIFADASKANNVLGWTAEKSLEEMVRSAWKWQQYIQASQL
jgi:UDP-glucose 4-epimerase